MRILTAEAMREVDRAAIETLGLPSLVLMENAAIGVVEATAEAFPDASSAAIFCGPGNNGGDGLAVARHLAIRGWEVRIFLVGPAGKTATPYAANARAAEEPKPSDFALQLGICRRSELSIFAIGEEKDLKVALEATAECDVVIDALFGTGLSRPLDGLFARVVAAINRLAVPCVAVDLPSGLAGSEAQPIGPHIEAVLTVTFAAPKIAHVFPPAADAVGEMVVAGLGIPPQLIDDVEEEAGDLHLLMGEELADLLPEREAGSHKGDYGHALIVAGSSGKAGACILAARAAVRAGAGLVTAAVPAPILQTVDLGSIESMTLALPADEHGRLAAGAADAALAAAEGKTVLALGPGLGAEPATVGAIRRIVLESSLPLVLDADGINAFAGKAGGPRRPPGGDDPHPAPRRARPPAGDLDRPDPGGPGGGGPRRRRGDRGDRGPQGAPDAGRLRHGGVRQSHRQPRHGDRRLGGRADRPDRRPARPGARRARRRRARRLRPRPRRRPRPRPAWTPGGTGLIAGDLIDLLPAAFAALKGEEEAEEHQHHGHHHGHQHLPGRGHGRRPRQR